MNWILQPSRNQQQTRNLAFTFLVILMTASAPKAATRIDGNPSWARTGLFVPNLGQWNAGALFGATVRSGMVFIGADGELVYSLVSNRQTTLPKIGIDRDQQRVRNGPVDAIVVTERVRIDDAETRRPLFEALDAVPDVAGYALGATRYVGSAPGYGAVNLNGVGPNIDLQLRATGGSIEKIFTVLPGGDPAKIRMDVRGASALAIDSDGSLVVETVSGSIGFTAPSAYQVGPLGDRRPVSVRYVVAADRQSYGFDLGQFDPARALIIDPLLQSAFVGGAEDDRAVAIAIHPATGDIYIAGATYSSDFPGIGAPTILAGGLRPRAFVTRLNPSRTTLFKTFIFGGSISDEANAIAIHPRSGEVYVAGPSFSPDFPNTAGSDQPAHASDGNFQDAFVTRFDPMLTAQLQSTYLGGNGNDNPRAMAIHPYSGEVYLAGFTRSTDFPKTGGSERPNKGPVLDSFVARLSASLTARLQSTYFGSNNELRADAIAIHPGTGEVYVAGYTYASDIPKLAGAEQAVLAGPTDGFVSRLSPQLTEFLQSTYLGGSSGDWISAMAIHPATGDVFVTGTTFSTDFPLTAGSDQPQHAIDVGLHADGFVARLNRELTVRVQSTYLGGNVDDFPLAMAIDPFTGDVYVGGGTDSSDLPKVAGGVQPNRVDVKDAFLCRLDATVAIQKQCTYLGGHGQENILGMAIHPSSEQIYVVGETESSDWPGIDTGQVAKPGKWEGFVSRLSPDLLAQPDSFSFPPRFKVPTGSIQTSAPARITGVAEGSSVSITGGQFGQFCISSMNDCSCDVRPFAATPSPVSENQYVCLRQAAPFVTPAVARMRLMIGGAWTDWLVSTGLSNCSLDIDGNGVADALTDGLLILRALFGLTGTVATNNAVGPNATRGSWALVQSYFNGNCGTNFAP